MKVSIEDYLRVAAPQLASTLVAREALSNVQALAQNFPPLSVVAFECRLEAGQSRVDFSVSIPWIPLDIPEVFLAHSVWQDIQHFCRDLTEPESELRCIINRSWLEFDLIDPLPSIPIPCFGFSLNPQTFNDHKLWGIAIESLLKLLNSSQSELIKIKLNQCLNCLPNQARISHIGGMLSRPEKAIRIVVTEISPQQLPHYLRQIGWTDSRNMLPSLVQKLSDCVDSIGLALNVKDTVYPEIGLECSFNNPSLNYSSWQLFINNYLIQEGLCTPAKGNALLAWLGFSQKTDRPELWPRNLNVLDPLFSAKAYSVFCRTINHIKIVYRPDSPLSAKAYLFFQHLYLKKDMSNN